MTDDRCPRIQGRKLGEKTALIMARNAIAGRYCRPKYCSDLEFRRIAHKRTDRELLAIRNVGRKALAAFREAYGQVYRPGPVERPEDV